jgi:energy-converting hydrogenase A subunit M
MTGAEIIKPKSNLELVQEAILLVTNIYKEDIFKPLAQALTT